jgi:hypothetical protein
MSALGGQPEMGMPAGGRHVPSESVLPDAGRGGVLQKRTAILSNFSKAGTLPILIRVLQMKIAKIVSQSREPAGWA